MQQGFEQQFIPAMLPGMPGIAKIVKMRGEQNYRSRYQPTERFQQFTVAAGLYRTIDHD